MVEYCMYKRTSPQQKLFGIETEISPSLRSRLESSWAHLFRHEVLPILFRNEDQYRMLYGTTGRPNFSVARLLGLCLLQEWNDLSDQQALDAYSFDIRWRYALDISDDEDYLSRRSLVEFRRRLAALDPDMSLIRHLFDTIRDSAIHKLGLSSSNQRLDSTHIISNIRLRGRLALFSNTLDLFLKRLNEDQFSRVPEAIQKWHSREPEGWFGLGPSDQKAKLQELAHYLHELILLFEKDEAIISTEPYQVLTRLFSEQCEVSPEESSGIHVKKKTEGTTLQSPYDPDASYGHKGSGYSLHITETCNNEGKPEIITDYEVHGAARSDIGKALPVIERLESAGLKPDTLFADGGYPSVPSVPKVMEQDIEFMTPVNRSRLSDDVVAPWGRVLSTIVCSAGTIVPAVPFMRSSMATYVDHVPCLITVRCGLPTIATKVARPRIPSGTSVWRSPQRFAYGMRCIPCNRPVNGRTGTRSAQGLRQRTPS